MDNSVLDKKTDRDNTFGVLVTSKFFKDTGIDTSFEDTIKETVLRPGSNSIEKLIEYHPKTKMKIRVTNYNYFNDKKIKSIEEFDSETGFLTKITSYTLFKSITEYDIKTGKKVRTTNYDIKDETKKISVYDFDIELEKINRITIFRTDGNSVNMVKELNPVSGMVLRTINYKKNSTAISSISKYEFQGDKTIKTTFYYNTPIYFTSPILLDKKITADTLNKKVLEEADKRRITKLIDNLYRNKLNFSAISI